MRFLASHRTIRSCLVIPAIVLASLGGFTRDTANAQEPAKPSTHASEVQASDLLDELRKNLSRLAREVESLTKRVAVLEKERLFDVTRVLLVGEEQRAEALQTRLRENTERMSLYQVRLEQVDHRLRPENIERLWIGVGMVRPEEARETVRRQLTTERQALLAQVELLRQERARYLSALSTSDIAIQRLRLRLAAVGAP